MFHYIISDGVCYLTLCEKSYPKRLAFAYLSEVCEGFVDELKRDHADGWRTKVETVRRRYSRLKREQRPMPDLILIDGGKGQLGMACRELAKLGLGQLPVIGLAKEFEEIYQPGESKPLRLGLDSGALKLLQRVRDESHRFANNYNADLRLKKISESVLDDLPGIGGSRKAALLKQFGSVHRLRSATLDEIQQVPGFGKKSATALKAFLETRPKSSK